MAERIGRDPQVIKRMERGTGSIPSLVAAMEALDFSYTGIGPGHTLPEQLRQQRIKRGLSRQMLSERTGLSRTTIANVEAGGGSIASIQRILACLAPRATRKAKERAFWGNSKKLDRDSRFTPPDFMENIYEAFGAVDCDPCAHQLSPVIAKSRILLNEGGDGLVDDWSGRLAFVNPPFSSLLVWLRRAHDQWKAGNVETIVCLGPNRTDSAFFHSTVRHDADVFLLEGRVKFLDPRGGAQHTPFSLMLMTLGATAQQKARYAELVKGCWCSFDVGTK